MKTLILCRHAKSDWPPGVPDFQRPLKERGIKDATYLASLLADQGLLPDLMLSSSANRAYSTAEIFAEKLAYPKEIEKSEELYLASVNTLIATIHTLPSEAETVMIFGHNPTMESGFEWFMRPEAALEVPTCGMVCLDSYEYAWEKWNTHNVNLRWYLIPRLKRKRI